MNTQPSPHDKSQPASQPNGSLGESLNCFWQFFAAAGMVATDAIGEGAAHAALGAADLAMGAGETATQQLHQWLTQTTQGAGQAVTTVANNPVVRFVTKNPVVRKASGFLKLDWLMQFSEDVDLEKATTAVRQLQEKYPHEQPRQIAHRIMVEKAMYAGGVGFASSIIPGVAAALLAVDWAATSTLQTEMLYQIAAAYGLDLKDPARRGEILAIFGLALGGGKAVRLGLGFLRNVPFAGAMIGAGTNATVLYALGYAACNFYEAKLANPTAEPRAEALENIQAASEQYLEVAISQQAIMDQILVHMILASYPEKTWEDIVPELQALQLEPSSISAIATHIQSPQPLSALLDQLNQDFAAPLWARCYGMAQLDGEISPAEAKILEALSAKLHASNP